MVRVGDNAFDIVDLERNYTYEIYSKKATITITEAPATRDINILYPWNMPNKNKLIDAPYCMFAMPLNATKVYKNEANTYYTNPFISLEIATNFASTEACFDLQLVPYCP